MPVDGPIAQPQARDGSQMPGDHVIHVHMRMRIARIGAH